MLRFRSICVVILSFVVLSGCSPVSTAPVLETASQESSKKPANALYERNYFTQGDQLDLQDFNVHSMSIISSIRMECSEKGEDEYLCGASLQGDRLNAEFQWDAMVHFDDFGQYLSKITLPDGSEKVFPLTVVADQDAVLSNPFKAFRFYRHVDTFSSTISHFELRGVPDEDFFRISTQPSEFVWPMMQVRWSVDGGRFHILDKELPYMSVLRPFERSILFKEKRIYSVTAEIWIHGKKHSEKKFDIDMRGGKYKQEALSLALMIPTPQGAVNDEMSAQSEIHTLEAGLKTEWTLYRVGQRVCPKQILSLEDTQAFHVQVAIQRVCQSPYKERLQLTKDAEIITQNSESLRVRFHRPGEYAISYKVESADGELSKTVTRRLEIAPGQLSSRY